MSPDGEAVSQPVWSAAVARRSGDPLAQNVGTRRSCPGRSNASVRPRRSERRARRRRAGRIRPERAGAAAEPAATRRSRPACAPRAASMAAAGPSRTGIVAPRSSDGTPDGRPPERTYASAHAGHLDRGTSPGSPT